jgi:hypothetical protein
MRVGATRVALDMVVADFHQWHSAETIQLQHPALSLEEVYGALAFYLANQAEVHDYLRRRQEQRDQWGGHVEHLESPALWRRGARKAGTSRIS